MSAEELPEPVAIPVCGDLAHFEGIYAAAAGQRAAIRWADGVPNPNLLAWLDHQAESWQGRRVLVVACGLGDDAEALAARGARVDAFDLAPSAIAWCRRRFPASLVSYACADLFALPAAYRGAFELVVEINTLHALPPEARAAAFGPLATCLAEGGRLLVIARGRDSGETPRQGPPWRLSRDELRVFASHGLREDSFEDFLDGETPPVRRYRVVFTRQ